MVFLICNYKQSTCKTYTNSKQSAIVMHTTAITTHTPLTALEPCLQVIYAKITYTNAIRPNTAVPNIKTSSFYTYIRGYTSEGPIFQRYKNG